MTTINGALSLVAPLIQTPEVNRRWKTTRVRLSSVSALSAFLLLTEEETFRLALSLGGSGVR